MAYDIVCNKNFQFHLNLCEVHCLKGFMKLKHKCWRIRGANLISIYNFFSKIHITSRKLYFKVKTNFKNVFS